MIICNKKYFTCKPELGMKTNFSDHLNFQLGVNACMSTFLEIPENY